MRKICRTCLCSKDAQTMVPLIDCSAEDGLSRLGRSAKHLADISIVTNDGLPANMCEDCQIGLKLAMSFKNMCKQNDEILHNLLTFSKTKNTNIDTTVTEFVMFKTFFPETLPESYENPDNNPDNMVSEVLESCSLSEYTQDDYLDQIDNSDDQNVVNEVMIDTNVVNSFKTPTLNEYTNIDDEMAITYTLNESVSHSQEIPDTETENSTKIKMHKQKDKIKKVASLFRHVKNIERERKINVRTQKRNKIKNTTCDVCNKVMRSKVTLKMHMKLHDSDLNKERFFCEVCAKSFCSLRSMKRHQQCEHEMWEKYICDECGHTVPDKTELIIHMRKHTGERPYACDKCDKKFFRRYIWKQHAMMHTEKKFKCPKCAKKYWRMPDLVGHYNSHERLYLYQCHVCEIEYTRTDYLRKHIFKKHGVPRKKQGKLRKVYTKDFTRVLDELNKIAKIQ